MDAEPRRLIVGWLAVQPYLTAAQMAKGDNNPRRGGQLKPHIPKKNSATQYPAFIRRTHGLLRRMEADRILSSFQLHNNEPAVWYINPLKGNIDTLKELKWVPEDFAPFPDPPANWYSRHHEIAVGDLFISWLPHATHWDTKWLPKEISDYGIGQFRINYDSRMVVNGKVYLNEEDTGSEDIDVQLEPKVDKYIALSEALPYGSFQVLFYMSKYRRMSLGNRIDRFTAMLQEKRRGNQFLVTTHAAAVADPTGPIWISPLEPEAKRPLADLPYGS